MLLFAFLPELNEQINATLISCGKYEAAMSGQLAELSIKPEGNIWLCLNVKKSADQQLHSLLISLIVDGCWKQNKNWSIKMTRCTV